MDAPDELIDTRAEPDHEHDRRNQRKRAQAARAAAVYQRAAAIHRRAAAVERRAAELYERLECREDPHRPLPPGPDRDVVAEAVDGVRDPHP